MKAQIPNSRKGGCLFKLIKLFVLVAVILCVAIYFSLGLIADYALKTVTSGTGIEAGVSSVSLGITDQKVQIKNFFITNPPNFKKCDAIAFKEALFDAGITLSDVVAKRLIVIDEIKVVGLSMNMDIKTASGLSALTTLPQSNISEIQNTLMGKLGGGQTKQTESAAEPSEASQDWKIIIKKIVFDNGEISGSVNGKSLKINIPSFTLENLGTSKGGETPTELMADIVGQLAKIGTSNLVKSAIKGGLDAGESGAESTESAVGGAAKAVGNTLKSLFGN